MGSFLSGVQYYFNANWIIIFQILGNYTSRSRAGSRLLFEVLSSYEQDGISQIGTNGKMVIHGKWIKEAKFLLHVGNLQFDFLVRVFRYIK